MSFTHFGASFAIALCCASSAAAQAVGWLEQLGTSSFDASLAVSADGLGNIYIAGSTSGNLGGPNAGNSDAFVSKYDALGTLLWTQQLGTSNLDSGISVSADGFGNVYITGSTRGNLSGANGGGYDAFVSRYNSSGVHMWTDQFGTAADEFGSAVSSDAIGNIYIVGSTGGNLGAPSAGGRDAYVSKYNAAGTVFWTKQFGTNGGEGASGVSTDETGNIYVSGSTEGDLGAPNAGGGDAYISKFDAAGTQLWTKQLGTPADEFGYDVSADGIGNVYIAGSTEGNLSGSNFGSHDAFISKYTTAGTFLWTEQLGTSGADSADGVSADGMGNVYISGSTEGSLGGPYAGDTDTFISKYDAAGIHFWTDQYGTSGEEFSRGVSADGEGNVYISGYTTGQLGSSSAGFYDAFVAKVVDTFSGDFELDGDVDGFDFLRWQRGESPNPSSASDLADWQANYGSITSLSATLMAVLEPSTSTLLLFAMIALGRKSERERKRGRSGSVENLNNHKSHNVADEGQQL